MKGMFMLLVVLGLRCCGTIVYRKVTSVVIPRPITTITITSILIDESKVVTVQTPHGFRDGVIGLISCGAGPQGPGALSAPIFCCGKKYPPAGGLDLCRDPGTR